jgi:alpha-beta hydrolase superfamily lysophospholipase
VLAIGHGTTGIDQPCAPSLSKALLGFDVAVESALSQGYAVAMPDYQGLGTQGIHPYLDARTAGFNVIDAVRALRATFPDISSKWGAFGQSQGGGAVWAANEQANSYAPELNLVGSVAVAPAADFTGVVQKAEDGTLTEDQTPLFQWLLVSLGRLHPDLNLNDYRRGAAAKHWAALSTCSGSLTRERDQALEGIGSHDLSPNSVEAADRLRMLLSRWVLPQARLSAPLAVVYGSADTYVDASWTTAAINRACARGGTVVASLEGDKGHLDLDIKPQLHWLMDRFAGAGLVNSCGK